MTAGALNRVRLSGEITVLNALRHTPAGLPLMQFRLVHKSVQLEANIERRTEFEVNAVAIGEVAAAAARLQAGDQVTVQGFLAARRRSGVTLQHSGTPSGNQLILHVTQIAASTH